MSGKSRLKGSNVQNLAVDSSSYVYGKWISGGQLSPKFSFFDIQVHLATTATLSVEFATDSLGTGVFATTTLYASASFTAGQLIGVSMMAEGSIFYNIKPSATTTFRTLTISERFDW